MTSQQKSMRLPICHRADWTSEKNLKIKLLKVAISSLKEDHISLIPNLKAGIFSKYTKHINIHISTGARGVISRGLTTALKYCKALENITFSDYLDFRSRKLNFGKETFRGQPKIKSFKLFLDLKVMQEEDTKYISQAFKHMKTMKSFELVVTIPSSQGLLCFESYSKIFTKVRNLEELKLVFQKRFDIMEHFQRPIPPEFIEKSYQNLIASLKQLKLIRSLHLDFSPIMLDDLQIQELESLLTAFPNQEKLILLLPREGDISAPSLARICSCLKLRPDDHVKLRALTLCSNSIIDESFLRTFEEVLSHLKALEHFSFGSINWVGGIPISTKAVEHISRSVSSLQEIKSLHLRFSDILFNKEGQFQPIIKAICSRRNLRNLKLELFSIVSAENLLWLIADSVKRVDFLKKLHLKYEDSHIQKENMSELADMYVELLNVSALHLEFGDLKGLDRESLQVFLSSFKKVRAESEFTFSFRSSHLGNEVIQSLKKTLCHLPKNCKFLIHDIAMDLESNELI